ncbi:MAG: hypothetical protein ABW020_06705 [Candidatus Rokuibacteriota bacterium]
MRSCRSLFLAVFTAALLSTFVPASIDGANAVLPGPVALPRAEAAPLDAVPDSRYARLTHGVNLVGWFSAGGDIPFTPIGPSDARIIADSGPELLDRPQTVAGYVAVLYRAILGRAPTAGEVTMWATSLEEALASPIPIVAASPEFRAREPDPRNRGAVEILLARLYENVVGRAPAGTELGAWADYLAATADVAGVARAFFASAEYTEAPRTLAERVTALYRAFLGRDPSPAEASAWIADL